MNLYFKVWQIHIFKTFIKIVTRSQVYDLTSSFKIPCENHIKIQFSLGTGMTLVEHKKEPWSIKLNVWMSECIHGHLVKQKDIILLHLSVHFSEVK